MCVTAEPAEINSTRTYVYATDLGDGPVHVCGYQNEAETGWGGNCMFLNFAGSDLKLVHGPERTTDLMRNMTEALPDLVYQPKSRGMLSLGLTRGGLEVVEYGDYTVVLSQGPGDILSVLDQVPEHRRPALTWRLREMVDFFMSWFSEDTFALGCFDGRVKPKHPITVSYRPRNTDVLTIPGLDGHDGNVPTVGAPVYRDFRVAFAVQGASLPIGVHYDDPRLAGEVPWAPTSVTGFTDNRAYCPNGDYVVPVESVLQGLQGPQLADVLQ